MTARTDAHLRRDVHAASDAASGSMSLCHLLVLLQLQLHFQSGESVPVSVPESCRGLLANFRLCVLNALSALPPLALLVPHWLWFPATAPATSHRRRCASMASPLAHHHEVSAAKSALPPKAVLCAQASEPSSSVVED